MRTILWTAILMTTLLGCSGPQQGSLTPQYRTGLAAGLSVTMMTMSVGELALHYADTGGAGLPTVVFIHGTPGSWRSLGRLFDYQVLTREMRLVSIDRPGWGNSLFPDDHAEGSFDEQVRLIEPLLRKLHREAEGQPMLLAGHSLGASIAPYVAFRHPELVDGLLMAAGAIDPELGKPRWYNHAANIWPVSRLIDHRLVKANVEIWGVYSALEELEPWWETVTIPMIYVQGEEDELVHPGNLDFAENSLPADNTKVVRIPGQGHLLHRQQTDLLASLLVELLDQTRSR